MGKAIISTKDLCKTYFSEGEGNHVIKNINLDIYDGEFTVIMGSSGSGKSTLLYLLSGLESVTSGEVYIKEKYLSKFKKKDMVKFRRTDIGFVYQGINLVPSLNLFENIVLPAYLISKDKKAVDERANEFLKALGIYDDRKKLPNQVSGGQQQRTAIGRAVINNPSIIFADEPTGALNSSSGQNVLNILSDLNKKGQSIVMVTHDIKSAIRAHRVLFLRDGRIEGNLYIGEYKEEFKLSREKQVLSYLDEMGW